MQYELTTGIRHRSSRIKLLVVALAAALVAAVAASNLPASAAYCDQSSNGCDAAANAGAQCGSGAGSGAFGAFGDKGDVSHDWSGGANGTNTGLANSSLCGNRQGNL